METVNDELESPANDKQPCDKAHDVEELLKWMHHDHLPHDGGEGLR